MTKVLLVEDDKSLREIYGVRLLAEGYDIVSASDGEEALAMAIKERPVLIITDIMMPKISGFDMLDILRSTTETRDIKVIVMTALGSDEQRQRGEQLGADRYLVKSQVGIEDVVRTVHEVLEDQPKTPIVPIQQSLPPAVNRAAAPPVAPPQTQWQPTAGRTMAAQPAHLAAAQPVVQNPSPSMPTQAPRGPVPVGRNRIIQPLNAPTTARVDINDLLDRELAREAGVEVESPAPQLATPQVQVQPPAPQPATSGNDLSAIQIDSQGNVNTAPPPATGQPPQQVSRPAATGIPIVPPQAPTV